MNLLRIYGTPLVALIPVAVGLGLLWYYLLPLAKSDGLMILLFLFMCLLAIAASALVQFVVSTFSRQSGEVEEYLHEKTVDGAADKPK